MPAPPMRRLRGFSSRVDSIKVAGAQEKALRSRCLNMQRTENVAVERHKEAGVVTRQ